MRILLLVTALLCVGGCTDEGAAREALASQGFTDIRITGWSPMTCAEEDFSSTGFVAKNARGIEVKGVVCCGMLFKSCTVRW